uniref:Uncharacterized protein n=1 Tax=Eubacterium plexicaudatum ASF492 TaxID=1235802 RepID=N2A2X9_9FIRM
MNKGISKEMEIREVMKWQLLIAGAVDAAIKGDRKLYPAHGADPPAGRKEGLQLRTEKPGVRYAPLAPWKCG